MGLERIQAVLDELGSPHTAYPCIHVAGTNGKGSTCAMIASVLDAHGLRAGFYSSPHLFSLTERFSINGVNITEPELACWITRISKLIEKGFELSYFEFTTAVAFGWFAQEKVDVAIVEVGLGGRLDATNVIIPDVSVITSIGLDHMSFLGTDLEAIAYEKAGIIKRNGRVVSSARGTAERVIKDVSNKMDAQLFDVSDFITDINPNDNGSFNFNFSGLGHEIRHLSPSLLGVHQVENAALATASSILFLEGNGGTLDEGKLRTGLSNTRWPSRLEPLRRNNKGLILLDGAHNKDGISCLQSFLKSFVSQFNRRILLMACSDEGGDKAFVSMFNAIEHMFDTKVITQPPGPRHPVPVEVWAETLPDRQDISFERSWEKAVDNILEYIGENDLVVITGSLYLAGAARHKLVTKGFH